ncbi:Uncharacterised protein [Mycobacteroides abscessus subsp. abscessus]|nr:Uncharacterised protein [Mycobacteroides abscessus subsp. abscessus]SKW23118.1 Uncharacterised protein [Mycobacteroides abscessus subsp. abscessus]
MALNSGGTSPSGRVTPLTRPTSGSCAMREAICSKSARACGVRKSRGD